MKSDVSARFIEGVKGRLFLVVRVPRSGSRGVIVFVPPFGEEMNKSRRMMAETALLLAEEGFTSVIPDFFGTGDSEGEFSEATWSGWRGDLESVVDFTRREFGPLVGIVAIRLGCSLVHEYLGIARLLSSLKVVFWAPVFNGSMFLREFLRLRVAAAMMSNRRETMAELTGRFSKGDSVEVAGYEVGPTLFNEISAVGPPEKLSASIASLRIVDLKPYPESMDKSPSRIAQDALPGCLRDDRVTLISSPGEPFWSAGEIVVNPEVIASTHDFFSGKSS